MFVLQLCFPSHELIMTRANTRWRKNEILCKDQQKIFSQIKLHQKGIFSEEVHLNISHVYFHLLLNVFSVIT